MKSLAEEEVDGVKIADLIGKSRYNYVARRAESSDMFTPADNPSYAKIPAIKKILEQNPTKPCDPSWDIGDFKTTMYEEYEVALIPKGTKIYKGLRSFYPPDYEFPPDLNTFWFGNAPTAVHFATNHYASINAYKFNKSCKLMVMNKSNAEKLTNVLKKLIDQYPERKVYKTILAGMRVKMGVDIDPVTRLDDLGDTYRSYKLHYLDYPSDDTCQLVSNEYRRLRIDRMIMMFVNMITELLGMHGIIAFQAQSIFYPTGYLNGEIGLKDISVLTRTPKDPLDWWSWKKYLDFKMPQDFIFNPVFSKKNFNHLMIKFYIDNITTTKPLDGDVVIGTLNVNYEGSINLLHTVEDRMRAIFEFMKSNRIALLGIQEYIRNNDEVFLKLAKEYGYYTTVDSRDALGDIAVNVFISKKPLNVKKIYLKGLPKRKRTVFITRFAGKTICLTHLELISPRNWSDAWEVEEAAWETSAIHFKQLRFILSFKPDIILGDFNMNKESPEYTWLTQQNWEDNTDRATTPFGTTVDFIFHPAARSALAKVKVFNYLYSDHRAVLAVMRN